MVNVALGARTAPLDCKAAIRGSAFRTADSVTIYFPLQVVEIHHENVHFMARKARGIVEHGTRKPPGAFDRFSD